MSISILLVETISFFLVGSLVASFLGNLAYRRDFKANVKGRSKCEDCGKVLNPIELIPIIGWLINLGKCKKCGYKIPWYYPVSELILGFVFAYTVFIMAQQNWSWFSIALLLLGHSCLYYLAIFDILHKEIPPVVLNMLTMFGLILNLLFFISHRFSMVNFGIDGSLSYLDNYVLIRLVLVLVFLGFIFILSSIKEIYMGIGDLRFLIMIVLIVPIAEFLAGIWLGMILGGAIGALIIFLYPKEWRKMKIPYIPILVLGLWGSWVLNMSEGVKEYLHLLWVM
jgi:prepilin signal peptidase PulO-like enzyme (type II secretory pathway)